MYVEDVARAFEILLFKAKVGEIYNIGGTNEYANIDVAHQLIKLADLDDRASEMMTFVEDRVFNDLRYHINSSRLIELGNLFNYSLFYIYILSFCFYFLFIYFLCGRLGWREEVSWEAGLKHTFEWYKKNSSRFGDIENALVSHPRAGLDKGAHS